MKPLTLWIIIFAFIFGAYIVHTNGMCDGFNCKAQPITFGDGD